MLAHGRWFSPDTPASSTTKTGRHDIAEILPKVALNTKKIKSNQPSVIGNLVWFWLSCLDVFDIFLPINSLFEYIGVQHIVCCVCLRLVYPMLSFSLNYPFKIATSVFCNVYSMLIWLSNLPWTRIYTEGQHCTIFSEVVKTN